MASLSTGPQQARPYQHDADRRTRPRAGNRTPPKSTSPGTTTRNLPPHSLDQTIHETLSPADVHRPRHRLPLPSNHQHTPLRPTIHPEPRPTSTLPAIDLHIGDTPRPIRLHTITIPELGLPRNPHNPSRHLTLELPHRLPQSPPMSRTLETLHTEVPVHDPAQRQQAPNLRIRQRLHIAVQTLEPHSPRRTRPIPVAHEPQILRRSLNPPRTRPRLGQSHDNHSLPETPHGTIPAAGPAQGNDPWNRQHGAQTISTSQACTGPQSEDAPHNPHTWTISGTRCPRPPGRRRTNPSTITPTIRRSHSRSPTISVSGILPAVPTTIIDLEQVIDDRL